MLGNSANLGPTISSLLNCNLALFPISYLGIPIRPSNLHRADWLPLISRIESRLSTWKAHSLSSAGRLVLVKSVLSAIPSYWMSFLKLPSWVIKKIDSIRRSFLWNGGNAKCLVNWKMVCLHRNHGGLGITDLRTFNQALLSKWLWRLLTPGNFIWKSWILCQHYHSNPHLALHLTTRSHPSPFWSGVLQTLPRVRALFQVKVKSGNRCLFWLDTWYGQIAPR